MIHVLDAFFDFLVSTLRRCRGISSLVLIAAAFVLLASSGAALSQTSQRIQLAQLEQMFADMRARAPWYVDGPLLWGYFFFDANEQKLKRAAEELEKSGYRVVGLERVDRRLFRLHVERVEAHTPQSLHARNNEFYALAERLGIASYDGMDVGPAGAKRP
jgi:hypothetical protein